jgi:hypothetical protein
MLSVLHCQLLRVYCDIDSMLSLERLGLLEVHRNRVKSCLAAPSAGSVREHAAGFFTLQVRLSAQCTYHIERLNGQLFCFANNQLLSFSCADILMPPGGCGSWT